MTATKFILVIVALFLLGEGNADPLCPYGWRHYATKCYKKSDQYMTFPDCVNYCASQNARTLCIESEGENLFAASEWSHFYWIGYNDVESEGNFVWGPNCTSTYVNWRSGEPNDGPSGNYVYVFWDAAWIDTPPVNNVCQCEQEYMQPTATPTIQPSSPSVIPTVRPTAICPDGWSNFGEKCYKKAPSLLLQAPCEQYCTAQRPDATILCIENADQNGFILSQYISPVRIGYNDVVNEHNFVWGADCTSTYSNWQDGKPNLGWNGNYVYLDSDGRWVDTADQALVCQCEYNWLHPTLAPTVDPTMMPTVVPSDIFQKIRTSPTYKVQNGFAFAVRASSGQVFTWGEDEYGGDSTVASEHLGDVFSDIASSRFFFAARNETGGVVTWGALTTKVEGSILFVVANEAALVGVTELGQVLAVGSKFHGGDILSPTLCATCAASLTADVTNVTASAGAFAAMKADGSVFVWGNPHNGAYADAQTLIDAAGALLIVATRTAFAALRPDGTVVTWGDTVGGGNSTTVQSELVDVVHIIASENVFVAFKLDLTLVTWGYQQYGGNSSAVQHLLTNVVYVAHTPAAFAALRADGTVVTWGRARDGGDSSSVTLNNIIHIVANKKAFAAVTATGGLTVWGKAEYGGVLPEPVYEGVVAVYHTDRAFLALKSDGKVIVWGQAGHGGSPSNNILDLLQSRTVHTVCSNDVAFSVITTTGDVIAWGHAVAVPVEGIQFTDASLLSSAECA